jgi:hypothetical protein
MFEELNVVIGVFSSSIGIELLKRFSNADDNPRRLETN